MSGLKSNEMVEHKCSTENLVNRKESSSTGRGTLPVSDPVSIPPPNKLSRSVEPRN